MFVTGILISLLLIAISWRRKKKSQQTDSFFYYFVVLASYLEGHFFSTTVHFQELIKYKRQDQWAE